MQRLRKRGKLAQAIALQRPLCEADEENGDEWQLLVKLAQEGNDSNTLLFARVQLAKIEAVGPDEWLELATVADAAGAEELVVDATFRAADASARLGDCKRALELCEKVISLSPKHRPARMIRGIMERRLAPIDVEEEGTWKQWPHKKGSEAEEAPEHDDEPVAEAPEHHDEPAAEAPERGDGPAATPPTDDADDDDDVDDDDDGWGLSAASTEFDQPAGTPVSRLADAAEMAPALAPTPIPGTLAPAPPRPIGTRVTKRIPGSVVRQVTSADTPAPADDEAAEESEGQPTDADKHSGADSFVWMPQTWPSVLDWNCLMFVGGIDRIHDEVLELAEEMELPAQVPIYEQGKTGQLLYCLDEGEVRASRERGVVQDFGTISAGSFFGEVSTITGFPSSATVSTQEPCRLRVFTRERFQSRHRAGDPAAERLLSFLRIWYLEVAANLNPLLSHCSPDELAALADSSNWTTLRPGDSLAEEGKTGDLFTIIAGLTEVERSGVEETEPLGFLTSGDLVGAMNPSPITVRAKSLVFALNVNRDRLEGLAAVTRSKLDEHVSDCKKVLKWLDERRDSEKK
ncbi:MAG: cyclic nucleotide-binding domain-containing protein [Deltaproteobacteria bacterium]|nr:cyclic nucleotide-binding domain-containing protein [Deltaproteobacteria bacterium]